MFKTSPLPEKPDIFTSPPDPRQSPEERQEAMSQAVAGVLLKLAGESNRRLLATWIGVAHTLGVSVRRFHDPKEGEGWYLNQPSPEIYLNGALPQEKQAGVVVYLLTLHLLKVWDTPSEGIQKAPAKR